MSEHRYFELDWLGSDAPCFDRPFTAHCGDVVLGCYGGNSLSGADKNEDAALIWNAVAGEPKFALLLDAHNTIQSARLVLEAIQSERERITSILARPVGEVFCWLERFLVDLLRSETFKRACRRVQGETACLVCAQKEQFLYWFSIGDCQLYLLHPELARLGQTALNQRNYYEWVGRANSFDLPTPCYSSGVRELRRGESCILATTDGLLECGSRPFEDPATLYDAFMGGEGTQDLDAESSVLNALRTVHEERGRDSATLICWRYENHRACTYPS